MGFGAMMDFGVAGRGIDDVSHFQWLAAAAGHPIKSAGITAQ